METLLGEGKDALLEAVEEGDGEHAAECAGDLPEHVGGLVGVVVGDVLDGGGFGADGAD